MNAKDAILWLPRTYAQGARNAATLILRRKSVTVKSITTEQAHQSQRARHDEVKAAVKAIFPHGAMRQWSSLYRDIGDAEAFGMVASYLRVIVLNEADGEEWNTVYDEAMASEILSDAEKDILVELVLDMQERSLNVVEYVPLKEQEREFAEMLAWKTENA